MDRYGTVVKDTKEIFSEENGVMVSNFLYEGISSANGGVNVGYKVVSKDGNFQGLLDQEKLAIWNTNEDSLKQL